MIETKLRHAAQELPAPTTTFSSIKEKAYAQKKSAPSPVSRHRCAAAILACAVLLMGCTVAAATTEVPYVAWSSLSEEFAHAQFIADRLGVVLPEALGDGPFCEISTMYVVPEGTSYLEALVTPAYQWYSVDYGGCVIIREFDSDDPDSVGIEVARVFHGVSLSVGSTEEELWQHSFCLDESGTLDSADSLAGSYHTEEYGGITLQMDSQFVRDWENNDDHSFYIHRIVWVDEGRHAVFTLSTSRETELFPEELIDFAKEVIDLNASGD